MSYIPARQRYFSKLRQRFSNRQGAKTSHFASCCYYATILSEDTDLAELVSIFYSDYYKLLVIDWINNLSERQFTPKAQELLQQIRDTSLIRINFDQNTMALELGFSFEGFAGGVYHEVILLLSNLTSLTLMPMPNGKLPYLVREASLVILEEDIREPIFRLYIEGDVEIKADAKYVQLYEETRVVAE